LSGGHISPILVACEKRGIRIIDTRHEANAAFAGSINTSNKLDLHRNSYISISADAVSRLSGKIGVCVVTAGPGVLLVVRTFIIWGIVYQLGLTNTITAIKNAQMAESPLLLIGGCAANLSKGRGALQDIDQMSLFKSICKSTVSIKRVRQIPSVLRHAICLAQSGTPGRKNMLIVNK
jgi:acetolactate synthase-like protein